MDTNNGQSASKPLNTDETSENEEGSTTIPQGSTGSNTGKKPVYLKYVIYRILNTVTGKFYIGSASHYQSRKDKHLWGLRRNKHANKHLQSAYNKHKEESFVFEVAEIVGNKKMLLEREQAWLDNTQCYNPDIGYNISTKAESRIGTTMSPEARKKIGDFWRGKRFSEERIKNVREARTKEQGKAVLVYNKDMKLLGEYCSISEASRQIGVSVGAISKQCSSKTGDKRTYKNSKYIFRYKNIV